VRERRLRATGSRRFRTPGVLRRTGTAEVAEHQANTKAVKCKVNRFRSHERVTFLCLCKEK